MAHQTALPNQDAKSGLLLRRRNKVIGFLIAEGSAIGVLLLVGSLALSLQLSNSSLALLINVVTIAAGVAVAIIPIIFFAVAPVLPGGR